MGDNANSSSDWKTERISMTHLANFSRSSSYVRSLVRQQFHNQSDQPNKAWERLRERLAKNSSFDYDEEMPSFVKKRESGFVGEEHSDDNEDEDDEEETYVYLKTANPSHRSSITADVGRPKTKSSNEESAKTPPSSHGHASASSSRCLSTPQTPGGSSDTEKQYTLASTDAHSQILNRRLSLAENVIKNYSKYIRTPDEPQGERTTKSASESERVQANKQSPIVAISEEESSLRVDIKPIVAISEEDSSPLRDVKLMDRESPALSPTSNCLVIPGIYPLGSSYTVPPSPAAESDTTFFDAPLRRKSFSGKISEEFSLTRSVTDVTSVSTKSKLASNAGKLPRLSATQTSKAKKTKLSAKSRDEEIQKLRGDYEKMTKNKQLNRQVGRKKETLYQQLQRDQERRAKESAVFFQEMEQITKSLKAINSRLDERIKILDCADPQKARYQRILQIAFANLPFKEI